jgi:hypothetical protein
MSITHFTWLALSILVATVGCGDDRRRGSGSCEPGRQVDCACPGGAVGFQVCRAAGDGYDVCQCDATDASVGSDGSATDGGGDTDSGPDACDRPPTMEYGCNECFTCAASGPCSAEAAACTAGSACESFLNCFAECAGDSPCEANCMSIYSDGVEPATALSACITATCPMTCTG